MWNRCDLLGIMAVYKTGLSWRQRLQSNQSLQLSVQELGASILIYKTSKRRRFITKQVIAVLASCQSVLRLHNVYLGSSKIHQELVGKQHQTQNLSWKSLEAVLGKRYDIYKRNKYIYKIHKEEIFNLPYDCY